jgi:hypothetical protein
MKKWIAVLLTALICMMLPLAALADSNGDDTPEISHEESSDTYKAWLMDSFDQTVLAENKNMRNQLRNVLYREEITVTSENYKNILRYVDDAKNKKSLSDGAALDHYTEEDYAIAVELIAKICDELDLDWSVDPSNDSQNEFARVITIKKNGKVLGKINSDAKTDEVEPEPAAPEDPKKPKLGWIIAGGVLIAAAAAFAVVLVVRMERKKKEA